MPSDDFADTQLNDLHDDPFPEIALETALASLDRARRALLGKVAQMSAQGPVSALANLVASSADTDLAWLLVELARMPRVDALNSCLEHCEGERFESVLGEICPDGMRLIFRRASDAALAGVFACIAGEVLSRFIASLDQADLPRAASLLTDGGRSVGPLSFCRREQAGHDGVMLDTVGLAIVRLIEQGNEREAGWIARGLDAPRALAIVHVLSGHALARLVALLSPEQHEWLGALAEARVVAKLAGCLSPHALESFLKHVSVDQLAAAASIARGHELRRIIEATDAGRLDEIVLTSKNEDLEAIMAAMLALGRLKPSTLCGITVPRVAEMSNSLSTLGHTLHALAAADPAVVCSREGVADTILMDASEQGARLADRLGKRLAARLIFVASNLRWPPEMKAGRVSALKAASRANRLLAFDDFDY